MLLPLSKSLLSLILISSVPFSASAADPTSLSTQMLTLHNHERALVGVAPLAWNGRLATDATAYAAHLVAVGELDHSSESERSEEGENLAMGTSGYYSPAALGQMWAKEKGDVVPGAFGDDSKTGSWEDIGHYTQMVWRTTTEVGCGTASGGGDTYLICRYAPAGNFIGERVF